MLFDIWDHIVLCGVIWKWVKTDSDVNSLTACAVPLCRNFSHLNLVFLISIVELAVLRMGAGGTAARSYICEFLMPRQGRYGCGASHLGPVSGTFSSNEPVSVQSLDRVSFPPKYGKMESWDFIPAKHHIINARQLFPNKNPKPCKHQYSFQFVVRLGASSVWFLFYFTF